MSSLLLRFGLFCGLLLPIVALAQTNNLAIEAEALADRAKKTAESGDLGVAKAMYERAFGMVPDSRYAWNVARLLELAGDFGESHRWYATALRTAASVDKRAKVVEAIGAVEAKALRSGFARLEVTPMPANATVKVDGVELPADEGKVVRWLRAGPHEVEVTASGQAPLRESVELERGGQKKLAPVLKAVPVAAPVPVVAAKAETAGGGWKTMGALAAGGVGVAAVGLGSAWLVSGAGDKAKANDLPVHSDADVKAYKAASEAANGKWTRGAVTAGVGAVALGAAGWMWFTRPATNAAWVPVVGPDGVGVALAGRW